MFHNFSVCFHVKSETNSAYPKSDSDEPYKIEDEVEERGNGVAVCFYKTTRCNRAGAGETGLQLQNALQMQNSLNTFNRIHPSVTIFGKTYRCIALQETNEL